MKTLNETHQKSCTQAGGPREEPATKALPAISPPANARFAGWIGNSLGSDRWASRHSQRILSLRPQRTGPFLERSGFEFHEEELTPWLQPTFDASLWLFRKLSKPPFWESWLPGGRQNLRHARARIRRLRRAAADAGAAVRDGRRRAWDFFSRPQRLGTDGRYENLLEEGAAGHSGGRLAHSVAKKSAQTSLASEIAA